jgi:PAS domain S-box-containing protein
MALGARSLAPLPDAMLRLIVEQASDGIFVLDTDLRVQWVNEAVCRMLGLPSERIVGNLVSELVEPGDLVREPLRDRELRAGIEIRIVRSFRTPSNELRLLEVSAKNIGDGRVLAIARDVTERLMRERLERSETSFRMLIERSPDVVMVHKDWRIVYLNPAAVRILELAEPAKAIGMHILDLVHPDDRDVARCKIESLAREGSSTPFSDMRFHRGGGRFITLSVGGVRVVFEGETSIVAVARDVGDQRRLQLQLAQSERMASLGTLAAGVGHEINNPLAYVLLNLEAINRLAAKVEPSLAASLVEHASSATEGAQRVAKIVRDLRAFSRFDDDARSVVDVRRALEVALSTASHELKHRARVTTMIDEEAPVLGSEGRLAQIFLNLLVNAAHAIREGHPSENEVRVSVRCRDDKVFVSVSDTGAGISDEDRPHLFEPFFTTKPTGEGSGLGLAICHGLVSAVGGTIEVESVKGKGSTFTVVLPRAMSTPPPRSSSMTGAHKAATRARVLVIDDEASICESIADVLGDEHDVVVTTSAVDARRLLEADRAFDVVVCDVVMPEMTGADLHRWLLEHDAGLAARMLFITGGRDGDAARALAAIEPWRWLEKPFTVDALEKKIGVMIERSGPRVPAGG